MGSDMFMNPPTTPMRPRRETRDEFKVLGHRGWNLAYDNTESGPVFDNMGDARAFIKSQPKDRWTRKAKIMHRVVSDWKEVPRR